jgi:tetratricopeptide (TPR) repeat protein
MDYRQILDRIFETVDQEAYLTPVHRIGGDEGRALQVFREAMARADFEPEEVRALVTRLHREGRIRNVTRLSALHIVACHPRVANYEEAARLAGEQELAALDEGGPDLQLNLASADRHRGVISFLKGHYELALDYFARALDRERSAENLGNVLCTLLRIGEIDEACSLLTQIRRSYPDSLVDELNAVIERDPDLALLRTEA